MSNFQNKSLFCGHSHGVVEVADDAWRLARCRMSEAGVVGVAEDSLKPGQRPG